MKVIRRSKSLEEYLSEMGGTVRTVNMGNVGVTSQGINQDIFREGNGVNMEGWTEGVAARLDTVVILSSKGVNI